MLNEAAFVKWTPFEGEDTNPHPSDVCEPINLACTNLPALVYDLKCDVSKSLSTLQLETIRRIFQSFATRGGFLLGDATGVGKGRTISGVLFESKARDTNFRSIWISANGRLKTDAINEISTLCSMDALNENVIFTSYTSLLQTKSFEKCLSFLNSIEGEKLIILDECHALRNNSTTAKTIEHLIANVSHVNILYSSATAASSAKHLEYLDKLQLWGTKTPFLTYASLASAIKSHGAPLMELLSIQMRSCGAYVSRQLSFSDVTMEHKLIKLTEQERNMYDQCTEMLRRGCICGGSSQQTFFQKLITGIKTKYAIEIAKERLNMGDSVVISLINTGEAFAKRTYKAEKKCSAFRRSNHYKVCEDILDELGEDVEDMPINPIDAIIEAFGSENVAELTGRTTTFKRNKAGHLEAYTKGKLEEEAQKFQSGEKSIAVLSRAGGVGISLHDNSQGKRRSHIILELPWSAEDFMQQLGRTHRSNSLSSPYYILLSTNIPSELRFVSAVVHKLSSMGALIRGDRSCSDVKWLDIPKWSTNTRRSLGLFLATCQLYGKLKQIVNNDKITIPDISRNRALAICGYTGSNLNVSEVSLKTRLTQMLSETKSTESDAPEHREHQFRENLSAVKALYPQDVCSIILPWSTTNHRFYPLPFQDKVFSLLLCYSAWETRHSLGVLPEVLLHVIIEHMSIPATVEEGTLAATRFEQHNLKLDELSKAQTDQVLNRLLGMEIGVQETITNFTSIFTCPKKSPPGSCFMNYIREKAGNCIKCEIADIRFATFSEGATGVQILMSYSPSETEAPPRNARLWKHERSGRVAYLKNHEFISSDGTHIFMQDASDQCIRNKGYTLVESHEWDISQRRHSVHVKRKCRKLPKQYYLATENAMNCWESSMHRILRLPPCIQFPKGLIGLLVFISA